MLYDQEPKTEAPQGSEETKEESYLFMKETIKSSRKKDFMQILKMAIGGLLFGIFACCGFFALKPWAESTFYEETEIVNIPEDEEPNHEEGQNPDSTKDKAAESEQNAESNESEGELSEETVVAAAPILSAESYEEIMQSMYDIAEEAEKSLVTIQSISEEVLEETEEVFRTTGTIVADNGTEYLILSDDSICEETDEWVATFVDNEQYTIQLKNRDKARGIAVFAVEKSAVKAATKKVIKVSVLGNSNAVMRGNVIIALGDMFGYKGAVGYGIVSSVEHEIAFADGVCGVIATDIEMASGGSGVLVNQSGEIIGLIRNDIWEEGENRTANALAISDLKAVLQLMLNGKTVPYVGIYGTTVTEEIAEEQEIPEGLYVTRVEGDSPAMQAGIQVGDIIQHVGGSDVLNINAYARKILNSEVGKEVKIEAQRRSSDGYVDVSFKVLIGSKE